MIELIGAGSLSKLPRPAYFFRVFLLTLQYYEVKNMAWEDDYDEEEEDYE